MSNQILLLLFCTPIFLASCSRNNNDNFDLSNLRIPSEIKNNASQKDITSSIKEITSLIKDNKDLTTNKLVAYQKVSQILDSTRFGKNDPFSKEAIKVNNLTSDLQLKGFLNTKVNRYVFVSYLGSEGTIYEGSIGGINTNLLPDGAKVVNIDSKNSKLIIYFENENYIFEL